MRQALLEARKDKPTISEIETELERLKTKKKRRRNIGYVVIVSIVAAAAIIIITNVWFPVLKVVGTSMQPRLKNGDIVVCFDYSKDIERGDVIAFYNNDSILLKRVVGLEGDVIEINESGIVKVNGVELEESYVLAHTLEPCDIEFPIEVPEDSFFVLGDQRSTSLDSRTESVGMVSRDRLVGKVLVKVWPIENIGLVE